MKIKEEVFFLESKWVPIACCGMRDGCSVTAVVQTNTEGKSALNRGIGKVLRLLSVSWQNYCS